MSEPAIRDAATVVLVRRDDGVPRVLMGQRGRGAAFMPSKFVFPGGAVDASDADVPLAAPLDPTCARRLAISAGERRAESFATAAIRELWEEAGLRLAAPAPSEPAPPPGWGRFAAGGWRPSGRGLRFFFRAVTPPGRPRRFDARFFLASAEALIGDPEDFSAADDELAHLGWVPLGDARNRDLPFITEVVLSEVEAQLRLPKGAPARPVPFFHQQEGRGVVTALA